ncbi:MAG: hypothetical protein A2X46_05290 [Lentisphaerae bacterium GWF2_57_35]|nr:MAG: hypothetical protein A2X46_05290 [Lentisphaerae bacterium GWF2_57_35]
MLKHRLFSGILIGLAFVVAALWVSSVWALVVLSGIAVLAAWEFYALLDAAKIPNFKIIGIGGCVLLIAVTGLTARFAAGGSDFSEALVFFFLTVGVFLRQFPQKDNPRPLETIAGTLMGVLYVGLLLNFITRLLMTWGFWEGRILILYLIAVVKLTDVGAYFVGCSFGRHKLIPRISPAKTWEGVLGGVFFGVLTSFLFYLSFHGRLGALSMSAVDALVLGLILALLGVAGDLTESLFKRAAGVKDSGRMILGMGGVLDVIDSLLFAAPALYIYARFFFSVVQ